MIIRQAGPADIPEMHRVRTSVRENRLTSTVLTEQDYMDQLTQLGRGWVAEVDGVVRGFAIANRETGNIWALFVDPGYEGRGIGRKLQATMLEWMRSVGCRRAWLETTPATRAERFYRESGWQYAGLTGNGDIGFEMILAP